MEVITKSFPIFFTINKHNTIALVCNCLSKDNVSHMHGRGTLKVFFCDVVSSTYITILSL